MGLSKATANPGTNKALNKNILEKFQDARKFNQHFHYCTVIGKLNYLKNINQPDIAYMVHQCTLLSDDPRKPNGEAVKRIWRYLKVT